MGMDRAVIRPDVDAMMIGSDMVRPDVHRMVTEFTMVRPEV
jgi:hypothetical protein